MPYKDREKQLEAQRRYYEEHKQKQMDLQRDRRDAKRKFTQSYKIGKECADCEISYPHYVLQYDHVRGEKLGNLSSMYQTHSLEDIKLEIAKCDIVCANCHAHRTWMRAAGVQRKCQQLKP